LSLCDPNLFCCKLILPLSDIFSDIANRKEVNGRQLDALSLFKKGIRPEWEDPCNKFGSELLTKKPIYIDIDESWESMVLALIGEVIEEADEICGCRIVEKTKKRERPHFRLELWLRVANADVANRLKNRLADAMSGVDKATGKTKIAPEFELKTR